LWEGVCKAAQLVRNDPMRSRRNRLTISAALSFVVSRSSMFH
jgi:hypothetical protein